MSIKQMQPPEDDKRCILLYHSLFLPLKPTSIYFVCDLSFEEDLLTYFNKLIQPWTGVKSVLLDQAGESCVVSKFQPVLMQESTFIG